MPLELTPGVEVTIEPPAVPTVTVVPPPAATVTVLPIAGPPGPQGPPGAAGVSTNASCVWTQSTPVYLVQAIHNLGFYPAGVVAIDTSGTEVEYSTVSYPSINITEVSFDVPFSGALYLS
jgi:hypothetical protein